MNRSVNRAKIKAIADLAGQGVSVEEIARRLHTDEDRVEAFMPIAEKPKKAKPKKDDAPEPEAEAEPEADDGF